MSASKRAVYVTALIIANSHLIFGQIVSNGSFESGSDPGDSILVTSGDTTISGWSVASGSIDYIGTHWLAAGGSRSIDLSGHEAGALSQTISGFSPGQNYQLAFSMAANTEGGPAIKMLRADMGPASQTFSFDGTGHSSSDMGWTTQTLDFTADSASMSLTFTSLTDGVYGPALDLVTITQVPEPGVCSLVLATLIGLRWSRRSLSRMRG